jgi:hypothetical protein
MCIQFNSSSKVIIIVREDNRSADEDEDKDKPGNKKDTQRQTIDTQHQKLKTHETHGPRTHGYLIVFTN